MADIAEKKGIHPFFFLATVALIFVILVSAQRVLMPLALAILFSFLLTPVVVWLQRQNLQRIPAVLLVVVAFFSIFVGIGWVATSQVANLAQKLPEYERTMNKKIASMRQEGQTSPVVQFLETISRVTEDITGTGQEPEPAEGPTVPHAVKDSPDSKRNVVPVAVAADAWAVVGGILATLWEMVRVAATIGLIVVLVIVMLIFREDLRDRMIRLSGYGRISVTTKALNEAGHRISEYMFRKSLVNSIFAAVVGLGLFWIEWQFELVHFAVLWAFLLVVLRFIPSLGTWMALAPPLLLTLIAVESWWPIFFIFTLYLGGELICVNIIEPWVISRHIGVSPMGGLVSLVVWTWVWGPVGLLLAIPLTVCLVVLGKYVPQLSFLSVLLSNQPAMSINARFYQRLLARDYDEATLIVEEFAESSTSEAVYDDIILPALSFARRDQQRGELTEQDRKHIAAGTKHILEDLWEDETPEENMADTAFHAADRPAVLGYAVHDEADNVGVSILQHLLQKRGYRLERGDGGLSSEMLAWIEEQGAYIVCLVSLGPGDFVRCRLLCKKLKRRFPDLKIVVARLGLIEEDEKTSELLTNAGAYTICTTLLDTRNQLLQLIHWLKYPAKEEIPALK